MRCEISFNFEVYQTVGVLSWGVTGERVASFALQKDKECAL